MMKMLTPADVAVHLGVDLRTAAKHIRSTPGHVHLGRRLARLPANLLPGYIEPPPSPPKTIDSATELQRRVCRLWMRKPVFDCFYCTYLVHAPSADLVKIGHTRWMTKRLCSLSATSPVPLALVAQFRGRALETDLHKHFAEARDHGEWFAASPVFDFIRGAGVRW